jgi:hypothetical protein
MQLSFCFFVKRASKACILLISWTSTGDIIDMAPSITKKISDGMQAQLRLTTLLRHSSEVLFLHG